MDKESKGEKEGRKARKEGRRNEGGREGRWRGGKEREETTIFGLKS